VHWAGIKKKKKKKKEKEKENQKRRAAPTHGPSSG